MNPLTVADTRIRQDANDRSCLNDLYKAAVASGANARTKEPAAFLRAARTQELLALLQQEADQTTTQNLRSFQPPVVSANDQQTSGIPRGFDTQQTTPNWRSLGGPVSTIEGRDGGTYVCIELVIAYGQFVSAAFDLKVIRTFLAVQHQQHAMPHIQSTKFWDLLRPHWAPIARLALAGLKNGQIAPRVNRSVGSVGRCLRRMFDVGYLNPVAVFTARLKPATAQRWAITKPVATQWGRPADAASAQLSLAI